MKRHPLIDQTTVLQRNPNQLFTMVDDEVVMLNIQHEEYLNLNKHASFIWQKMESPISFGALTDHLCSVYNVQKEVCIRDSLEFITAFIQKGIIQIVHEKGS